MNSIRSAPARPCRCPTPFLRRSTSDRILPIIGWWPTTSETLGTSSKIGALVGLSSTQRVPSLSRHRPIQSSVAGRTELAIEPLSERSCGRDERGGWLAGSDHASRSRVGALAGDRITVPASEVSVVGSKLRLRGQRAWAETIRKHYGVNTMADPSPLP